MKNKDGYDMEVTTIKEVEKDDDWYYLTTELGGYTFGVSKEECDGLVPKSGHPLVVYTRNFSNVVGIVIDGQKVRYKTPAQVERERIDWLIEYNQKKLDRLRENWDSWQKRVEALHPVLQKRVRRFESQGESNNSKFEFWLEDGGYELICLEGANALLKWAETTPDPVDSVKWWWNLNTKEYGYDYKRQMELVPEFGEGHSGNTAGAAYSLALGILTGSYTEE